MIVPKYIRTFTDLLLRWGKVHNLSSSLDADSIQRNIKDSMLPLAFLQPFHTCIDIGSGAGFPALILSCFYPNSIFYLLEPKRKKYSFLCNAVIEMGLKNTFVIDDYSYNVRDLKADLITSRAVCNASDLIKGSRHLLDKHGRYLLFKGSDSKSDINMIEGFDIETFIYEKRVLLYARDL